MIRIALLGKSGSWIKFRSESEFLDLTTRSQAWSLPCGGARSWTESWRKSASWVGRRFDSRSDSRSWRHQI